MSLRETLVDFQSFNANLERNAEAVQESAQTEAKKLSPEDAMNQARLVAGFNNAIGKLKEEDKGGGVMSSAENAIGSRIQSALVEAGLNQPGLGAKIAPAVANALEVKFDNFDVVGWLGTGFRLLFPPKPFPFRDANPDAEAVGDSIRVAMFSDWGSGLYGAPILSKKIAADPNYQLALHLGDVYYSGTEGEMKARFSQMYPKPAGAVGRALNGNHEMYSGGTPYIKAVEAELGQKSSCFAWQNTHWLLVGLDTSYKDATTGNDDHNLNDRQVTWLNGLLAKAGSRKVVLFSHHQPFSQLDKQGPKLVAKIEPILKSGRIHSWFWGHEHRCVLYDPHPEWGVKGRCVGHGGFPGFRDTFAGSPGGNSLTWKSLGTKKSDQGAFLAPPAQVLDGPNEFIKDGPPERYSPHGYVTLEFKGDQLREIYHNANGDVIEDPSNL